MKNGNWPDATSPDSVKKFKWILGRGGKSLGEMSFIDFGGEIYRKAFKDGLDATMALKKIHLRTNRIMTILQSLRQSYSCNGIYDHVMLS